jgi:S-adenosylmethionine:tRNA ribosyltransferase-isomerase
VREPKRFAAIWRCIDDHRTIRMPSSPNPQAPQREYTLSDFDFELPPELIAQQPSAQRSASRLLDGRSAWPVDRRFADLPALLEPGDLLVFNDTRVIKARLFGEKATGGAIELLVERVLPGFEVLAQLRASKSPRPGSTIRLAGAFDADVLGRAGPDDSLFHLRFPADPLVLLQQHGHVPLPPYITRTQAAADDDEAADIERYQSVFARRPGAVAAPTASLHFDTGLLAALDERGIRRANVTLHVGAGTFAPVRSEVIAEHRMHSEWYDVPAATATAIAEARARGGRVLAVGTTSLRALESAALAALAAAGAGGGDWAELAAHTGETSLFITPGFRFRVVDRLLTNFHLPRSTLLMLVSAFAGFDPIRSLYRHAIESRYRFFSYGDAMLLAASPPPASPAMPLSTADRGSSR